MRLVIGAEAKAEKRLREPIKDDKYIYILMAYKLAKSNGGSITIGEDNNMVGGQNFYRRFDIRTESGIDYIRESKTTKSFAEFSRYYFLYSSMADYDAPKIYRYITESGDDMSQWRH